METHPLGDAEGLAVGGGGNSSAAEGAGDVSFSKTGGEGWTNSKAAVRLQIAPTTVEMRSSS